MADKESYYDDAATTSTGDLGVANEVSSLREQIADLTRRTAELAAGAGEASAEIIDEAIHDNAYLSLGVAFLAGIAIGLTLRR